MATIKQSDLQLHGTVGSGGFGDVYRATWHEKGNVPRQVAVKDLHSPTDETELHMLTKLQHPNIIKLFGYVKEPSKKLTGVVDFMLVLEFGSGGSLRDYLNKSEKECPISTELLFDWMKQATLPIQYLKKHNVQHRDIKSPNYIITDGQILKLCDFGIAKEVKKTRTTKYAGSRRWSPPEYIEESKLSTKNDIYQLGLVFWEMMTRQVPFHEYKDDMEYQLMQAICDKKERPTIPPTCPKILANLLMHCWKEDRVERPTLDEILDVIECARELVMTSSVRRKTEATATQTGNKKNYVILMTIVL